ncbi:2TM domain-containing protein [Mangrovimonas aestuarii]|uniref:2TM domain-containing protein n=1 Tax=Mangrovimonas aestuarii TaxID=3018443 RepID=UPI00237868CF|nr:2TM domain-containing protein [Mangrovimonas aestuarii]
MENYSNKKKSLGYDQRSIGQDEAYLRAKKKVNKILGFYKHAAVYVVINLFLIALVAINTDSEASFWSFGTFSTAFFWGIGLAFHALGVFGSDLFFGKKWEERKIKEYMDRDKQFWE